MAFSKAHKFDADIHHFSLMCRALSHPARILILRRLIGLDGERISVTDLTSGFPLRQQTISQHLKILRDMSVLSCEEEYPNVYYSLNTTLVNTLFGLYRLVAQSNMKYNNQYAEEAQILSARRSLGTAPE